MSPDFGDELHLVIPPYSKHLRAVRMIAADTAGRAGLDYEDVEDFRLAVDELCHNLIMATDHTLILSFAATQNRVIAQGVTRARTGESAELPEMSEMILRTLSDSYEFQAKDGELAFYVTMTRAPAHR